jgi:phage repressor protein C with HTH and peptisase S24 domain
VVSKEAERNISEPVKPTVRKPRENGAKILTGLNSGASTARKRSISLYDLAVSAGTGVYLDDALAVDISIPDNDKTRNADFALRINGNSMEPKYHDGDIVLVEDTDSVEVGELGIFVLDGNGYFKVYGGDRLVSLNSDYGDIILHGYSEVVCCGRVVGKLKKRN